MKFGIVFPNSGKTVDAELAAKAAVLAEESGFERLMTWDHYMGEHPEDSHATFDAWTLLSFFAAKTSRIRLGTCVTPIPFRPPAQLAKVIASVDVLSEGRVDPGIGAGWLQAEFEGFSTWDDNETRFKKTKEGIELMLRLWSEPRVDFEGKYYSARGAVVEPKPVQKPHPPLWFGTLGRSMIRLAARVGDAWLPTYVPADTYAEGVKMIKDDIKEHSPGKKFTFAYNQFFPLKTAEEYFKAIESFVAVGCEAFIINWEYPKEEVLDRLRWFSKEIMPSYTGAR